MVTRVEVVSVVEAVTVDLRARVLRGELAPGTALSEAEVASRYDIARPTARAVIEALVFENLLERRAHKTARVVQLGPDDVRDIYRTRGRMETEVLRELAAQRLVPDGAVAANAEIAALADGSPLDIVEPDMRFHAELVDAVGSRRTSQAYRSLVSEVTLCMSQVQGQNLLSTALIAGEHQALLDFLRAGDADAAAALLAVHLGRARERLVGALGGVPGPEADLPSEWELNG